MEKRKKRVKKSNLPDDVVDGTKVAVGGLLKTSEGLYYTVKATLNLEEGKVSSFLLEKADITDLGLERIDYYITESSRSRA